MYKGTLQWRRGIAHVAVAHNPRVDIDWEGHHLLFVGQLEWVLPAKSKLANVNKCSGKRPTPLMHYDALLSGLQVDAWDLPVI